MTRRRRPGWYGLALGLLAGLGLAVTPAAAAQPTLEIGEPSGDGPPTVAAGDLLPVRLMGWPSGPVVVELCGNSAARGSLDCAVGSGGQGHIPPDGAAMVRITATGPPVACPCVVRARDLAGTVTLTAPIVLTGVDAPPATPVTEPGTLAITGLTVQTERSIGGWFGGPARRTLHLTVGHTGGGPVTDAPLTLLLGRGSDPATELPAPALGVLAPGAERSYQLPVTISAPAFGHYTIGGELAGERFEVETTSYPWGVPAALAVALVGRAGWLAWRLRRKPPGAAPVTQR